MFKKFLSFFKKSKHFVDEVPDVDVVGSTDIFNIIGKIIIDLHNEFYLNKINGWFDYSKTYIKLEDNSIVCLPYTGDKEITIVNKPKNSEHFEKWFSEQIIGNKIINVFYEFYENEPDMSQPSYILLSNNIVISEILISPNGTGLSGLKIYTKEEFEEKTTNEQLDLRSIFEIFK